ncbi:hypothetical protein [Streptomyces hirsutus]|uniref:hypothetical protein n=1 Tax=Streptomyces hirsutus TaxID=35620 RepID=UPI0033DDF801
MLTHTHQNALVLSQTPTAPNPCKQAANIMGINPATARTHRRLARKRIATKLGIDLGDDEEKE